MGTSRARGSSDPRLITWASPTAIWGAVLGAIATAMLVVVRFSRFPEWDEAVFLSQSGGFEGIDAHPLLLVASREVGTPVVLTAIRFLNPSLPNTRALWMALAFALLVLGLVQLGRILGFPPVAAVALVSTYWLSFLFWSSFFSIFIATACMLLATGIYLSLRARPHRVGARGVALGLALAACLWFRQAESALFVVVLVGHSLVVTPRAFWSQRLRGVASATATLVVAFGVPWIVDSVQRFGSVAERLSAGRGQSFERGLGSQFAEYVGSLAGLSQTYGSRATPPTWAVVVLGVVLVAGLVASMVCAWRRVRTVRAMPSEDRVRVGGVPLLWLVGGSQLAFFMFFIGVVMDRYMVSGALFVLVAVLATLWPHLADWLAGRTRRAAPSRRRITVALVGLFSLWVIANAAITIGYEQARLEAGRAIQGTAATIRSLAQGAPCRGVSRTSTPQLQFGTGCDVSTASTPADASQKVQQQRAQGGFRFLLWPARDADDVDGILGPRARSVLLESRSGPRGLVLIYERPEGAATSNG